jgi:hypothetical protein
VNDIISPRVLVVAASRSKPIDDHVLPALNGLGVTVVDVVKPERKGSLENIDAVLLMFQFCGRDQYGALRRQCDIAKVKFIILPQQASSWMTLFAENGLRVPGKPVNAKPLPKPPAPVVHPKQEAHETEPDEPASGQRNATYRKPFYIMLREERRAAGLTQAAVGELCSASTAAVVAWEAGRPIAADCVKTLLSLFPRLETAAPPVTARPKGRAGLASTVHVGGVSVTTYPQRPDVEVQDTRKAPTPPVAVLVPPVTSKPRLAPLEGLLKAARALGITGKVVVEVDDAGTRVLVGQDEWTGNYDDAVETARAALESRLDDAEREADRQHEERKARLAAARVLLQGAA